MILTADEARAITQQVRTITPNAQDYIVEVTGKIIEAANMGFVVVEVEVPAVVKDQLVSDFTTAGYRVDVDDWGDGSPVKLKINWR